MNSKKESAGESKWKIEFKEKCPLPTFTHDMGMYFANDQPIAQTPSMGFTCISPRPIPLDEVPEYVIGAYCALNGIMFGSFCMVHEYRYQKACGDEYKDCEGNSVKKGDFIAFQPPCGPRRYSAIITIRKSQDNGITYAYIHDRIHNFTILETSLLCKNHIKGAK